MSALPNASYWSGKNPEPRLEMVVIHVENFKTVGDAMVTFCQRSCHITDTPGYYSIVDMEYGKFEKSFTFRCAREAKLNCPPIGSKDYAWFQANLPEFKILFDRKQIITQSELFGNMRKSATEQNLPIYIADEVLGWLQQTWRHPEAIIIKRKCVTNVDEITRITRASLAKQHFNNVAKGIVENNEEDVKVGEAMREARMRSL